MSTGPRAPTFHFCLQTKRLTWCWAAGHALQSSRTQRAEALLAWAKNVGGVQERSSSAYGLMAVGWCAAASRRPQMTAVGSCWLQPYSSFGTKATFKFLAAQPWLKSQELATHELFLGGRWDWKTQRLRPRAARQKGMRKVKSDAVVIFRALGRFWTSAATSGKILSLLK